LGIITLLDRDRDGLISPLEATAYGEDVLSDVVVEFDGLPVPLTLARVEVPPVDDMRQGFGAIRLQALSELGSFGGGRHHVRLRNRHAPLFSVYLVNALIPEVRDIRVIAQTRDPQQQEVRIEYEVRSDGLVQLVSVALALGDAEFWCGSEGVDRDITPLHSPGWGSFADTSTNAVARSCAASGFHATPLQVIRSPGWGSRSVPAL